MGLPHCGYSAIEKREMVEKRVREDEAEAKRKREFEDDLAAKLVWRAPCDTE